MAEIKKATEDKSASEESTKGRTDSGSNTANVFSKLVGDLKLPEKLGSSGSLLKDKILFVLVGLLALRGAAGFAVDDVAGEVRNMFDRIELLFQDGALTGKAMYREARSTAEGIAQGGKQSILDYFNTAFDLKNDAKLTSLGQASGYLTRQIPELWDPLKKFYGILHDKELPGHTERMAILNQQRTSLRYKLSDLKLVKKIAVAFLISFIIGAGYGTEEGDPVIGVMCGVGVFSCFVLTWISVVIIRWLRRRSNDDNNQTNPGALMPGLGGGESRG